MSDTTATPQKTTFLEGLKAQPRFCLMCGTQYPQTVQKRFHFACLSCGYTLFENTRVATGAIITNAQDQILMVKRAIEPHQGMWDFPGGFSEPYEHPEETIKREILEELGVPARVKSFFAILGPNQYEYKGKVNYPIDIFYQIEVLDSTLVPQDDIAGFEWFDIENLPPESQLAFISTRQAVKRLKETGLTSTLPKMSVEP